MTQPSAINRSTLDAVDPLLCLDPDSVMLSGEDSLQLINRRGAFDLHAKNLQHLHRLFAPHLDGSRRESELISAVAAHQASAVRSYINTLKQSGALVEVTSTDADSGMSINRLGAANSSGRFEVGGLSVHISLSLQRSSGDELLAAGPRFLAFLTAAEASRWLAGLRRTDSYGSNRSHWQTLVVVQNDCSNAESSTPAELNRRAIIARWILSSAAGPQDGLGRLQIFRLAPKGVSLERVAIIGTGASNGEAGRIDHRGDGTVGLATLPDQLGLITSDEREQLPLVVARSRHPFVADHSSTDSPREWRYGLHMKDVRDALLANTFTEITAFTESTGLAESTGLTESTANRHTHHSFYRGRLGEPLASYTRIQLQMEGSDSSPTSHASNRYQLLVSLLEQQELTETRKSADLRAIDLLAVPGDDRSRCVQHLLRLHRNDLLGHQATTPGGAEVFTFEGHQACSFFPQKALLEILLKALYQIVYASASPSESAAPAVSYDAYATPSQLAEIVARFPNTQVALRGISIWGRAVWSGRLASQGGQQ